MPVIIERIIEAVGKLPPEAAAWLLSIIEGALTADDPTEYIRRRAQADAVHAGAQEAVRQALEELKPR